MKNCKFYRFFYAAFCVLASANTAYAADIGASSVSVGYTKHYGSSFDENLTGIAHDTLGNAFVAGKKTVNDRTDGFIRKYDTLGTLLWHRGKGSASIDGVAADKNGNAYIVGSYTAGSWPNERDYIYLQSFNPMGTPLWTSRFTVPAASDRTLLTANAIATDRQGDGSMVILFEKAYYPYQNRQVFIRKYSVSGELLWEKQASDLSSPYAARPSLAIGGDGTIYVAANSVAFQRWNTNLTRLDAQGSISWTAPFFPTGSAQLTYVHALTADNGGNVYLTGITRGNLDGENQGYNDAFLRKYGADGTVFWTDQFGTGSNDYGNGLTIDSEANIYVVGSSMGELSGPHRGSYDAFVRKYNTAGQLLKGRQFGTSDFDIANAVCVDDNHALYVGGNTDANLGGAAKGKLDIYLRKYEAFQ